TRRKAQPPLVERSERDFKPFSRLSEEIFFWDSHVVKFDERVLNSVESRESTAVNDLEARRVGFNDERGDFIIRWCSRHHDQDFGKRSVRAPEFSSRDDVGLPVGAERGARRDSSGIGSDIRLGQSESRNRAASAAGEK